MALKDSLLAIFDLLAAVVQFQARPNFEEFYHQVAMLIHKREKSQIMCRINIDLYDGKLAQTWTC